MAIDTVKLAELETLVTVEVLTGAEIVDHLREAGLVEVARELERMLKRPARRRRRRPNSTPVSCM
ncbi:hypothetical protein [Nocardia sp. NPDC050413]|uniref:hypothetical protein n=1 Tax=Nocardia sp. NPDC050413 TaxID=3155784 RepID=UPI0033ED2CB8